MNHRTIIYYLLVIGSTVCLTTCTHTYTQDELYAIIQEPQSGYVQHKNVGDNSIKVVYQPSALIAFREIKMNKSLSASQTDSIYDYYRQYNYFLLSISGDNREVLSDASNRAHFSKMVNQLVFNMNNYVHLYTNSYDTLQLVDYHYPRMYGMSSSTDMLFVFKGKEIDDRELVFKLNEFGLNAGDLKFHFKTDLIHRKMRIKEKEQNKTKENT